MEKYSSIVLRVGIGAVMIWFGSQQLLHPAMWTGFLPEFTKSLSISQITFIYLNGWFEIVAGILLVIGFYTRIVAFFLSLHMLGIVLSVGYGATGVRDFGLAIALISLFFQGEGAWSADRFFTKKQNPALPQS